jgi:D-alanyl-D-alanine dipeptidase
MPTDFDNFSDTAHHDFQSLDSIVLQNRALLKGVMEYFGFKALSTEWWHYSLPEPKRYPLMDISFRKLKRWTKKK